MKINDLNRRKLSESSNRMLRLALATIVSISFVAQTSWATAAERLLSTPSRLTTNTERRALPADLPKKLAGNNETDWTYIGVGLEPAWSSEGVELLRGFIDDDDMTNGEKILYAATGGTTENRWSGIVELPFMFDFYGFPFDKFCVNKSGLLTFDISVANSEVQVAQSVHSEKAQLSQQLVNMQDEFLVANDVEPAPFLPVIDNLQPGTGDDISFDLPNADIPNNTIAYFWGQFLPLKSSDDIYYFIYGSAPHRQAWIINAGHRKKNHLETYTALVLEETSNRFFVVDLNADDPEAEAGFLTVGAQRNAETAQKMQASPNIRVVGESKSAEDNAIYVFQPYQDNTLISGYSHANIDTAFDETIGDFLNTNNLPGALVAASLNGQLVFSKAYGYANVEAGIEMQPWHRSGIGSVSKVHTTLGVLKAKELSEDLGFALGGVKVNPGIEFSLDQPLYGLNGVFSDIDFEENILNGITDGLDDEIYEVGTELLWWQAYHSITPRHLLTHTAGFREAKNKTSAAAEYFGLTYEEVTYQDIHRYVLDVKQLGSTPSDSNLSPPLPEPVRSYSNHSFGLSGYLIEAITGTPYIDFMQSEIFNPLDLNVTNTLVNYANLTPFDAKRYYTYKSHTSYHESNFDGSRVYGAYGIGRGDLGAAAGGWVSSAKDLVRLMCATDQLDNQADILSPASLDEMESIPFPSVASNQPLGWDSKSNDGRLAKNGKTGAMGAYMAKYPSGINVAIIFNAGSGVNLPTSLSHDLEEFIEEANVPEDYDLFNIEFVLPEQK